MCHLVVPGHFGWLMASNGVDNWHYFDFFSNLTKLAKFCWKNTFLTKKKSDFPKFSIKKHNF
jgi:hypothetical protein